MKKIFFLKKNYLLILLSLICFQAVAQQDPDLPKVGQNIDKEEYLKARADFIAQKRGLPYNLPYDARAKAIEEKRIKEIEDRNNPSIILSAPNWVAEGPFPIPNGQTTGASVAVSGRVTAIAVHPTNANTVYVGTANGGIYRSMDGGTTWTAIFDNGQSLAIGALALAPSSPTTLYVGTGEANLSADSYFGVGVYRIDNADVSPTLVGPINPSGVFTNRSVSKILVHPTDPATIFVSTGTGVGGIVNSSPPGAVVGLFRSTNATAAAGSITFTKLTVATAAGGNRRVLDMVMEPGTPNNIICTVYGTNVAGDGGIYRSTDALAATPTFTRTLALGTGVAAWRCELAIAKVGVAATIFAGTDNGANSIYKSVDGGATFVNATGTFAFCSSQCFYDIALAIDPTDTSKFYIGGSSGSNIFQFSTNGGTSFTASTNNLHADVHTIVVAPSTPTTIYLGCDGGIFKSTNAGVTWASMNTAGFSATQFQSLAIHPIDTKFTIAGSQDNGTSMYKPDGTWNRIDFGDGGYTLIDQNAANNTNVTMYHTYFNQINNLVGLARVDLVANAFDGNWAFFGCQNLPPATPANGISCTGTVMFYAPIALGPGNPNTVYYCSDRLYRSINKGVNFTTVSQSPIVAGVAISTVAISKQDDNYRIVGLTNGQVWGTATGSSTLENITPPGAPATAAQRVYFDPNNKNIVYVCYGGFGVTAGQHIWKTTNFNVVSAPATWVASGSGIPDVPVNSFAIDPSFSNILYAGTDIGVYSSTDAGATWSSFSAGLPIVPVFDMAVHPVNRSLRIATHGRGLWSTTSVVLPIELTSFTATARNNGKVYLEWFTQSEQNNKGFQIERSPNFTSGNYTWEKIGFVNGSINSSTPKRYYFDDEPVGGKKFVYRLRQIDLDEKYKLSDTRSVVLKDFDYGLYSCYPNPVSDVANIKYKIPENNLVKIQLFDNAGKLIKQLVNENKEAGIYQFNFSAATLSAGIYFYKIEAGSFFDTKSFIVTK